MIFTYVNMFGKYFLKETFRTFKDILRHEKRAIMQTLTQYQFFNNEGKSDIFLHISYSNTDRFFSRI